MKRMYKRLTGLLLACLFVLALSTGADAQRHGGGGFHGRGGFGFGFGGPRIGFGFGFGRPAYYSPFYGYPRIGFQIGVLPFGYYPFLWGSDQYYYYGGTFYRPYGDDGYQVAAPPIGATVPSVPSNAHPITIDGQQYYELNGVYYKESVDEKGKKVYIVTGKDGVLNTDNNAANQQQAPQVGDVVNKLPDGCRKVTLNGKTYYVSADDIYYEQFTDANDTTSYRIASVPTNDGGNN